ncbi:hypothetical protein HHL22_14230 [Hymenobacter sp. RP-2-7]|uniref:DUF4251 domain-containing protein n=1 Tax=Hymenobacter polaris TaxID=2682546 RepID=A0A7Y0AFW8_9BACT|nr:hypothetical protein [Hymenobacter polaris]NML66365.1 hypothetical protein [Hymenobacter polaris]
MKKLVTLAGLLVLSLAAHAQDAPVATTTASPTPYQVQYDSLQARARRVRASAAARTQQVKTNFLALGGTRRVIMSLGVPRVIPTSVGETLVREVRIKKETVKHKRHGAIVRKVVYYGGSKPRLYEYYEDGQLVQLELNGYALNTGSGNNTFVTMRWLRGNYLTVSQQASTGASRYATQRQTFSEPAIIAQ